MIICNEEGNPAVHMLHLTPSAGMHFVGSQIVGVPLLTLNISSDASLLPNDRAHSQYCSTHNEISWQGRTCRHRKQTL